jgi:hypothetical protein
MQVPERGAYEALILSQLRWKSGRGVQACGRAQVWEGEQAQVDTFYKNSPSQKIKQSCKT